jgi:glycosyltransferase involved in cell wall biosynthesis
MNRIFHSTASIVEYSDFQHHLEGVDIVIVLELFSSLSRQFVEYCKYHGIPCVILVYELIPTHPLNYLPTHITNRKIVAEHASKFIAVSHLAAQGLLRFGIPESNINVVYPGINTRLFKPLADSSPLSNSFIFMGKYEVNKGIDSLLEAVPKILEKVPSAHFAFAGIGTYADAVSHLASRYENVKDYNFIHHANLPAVLSQYSTLVSPSRDVYRFGLRIGSEQYGFSIIEAMSMGMNIISSRFGAIPEVTGWPNTDCLLLQDVDAPNIYQAIIEKCTNIVGLAPTSIVNRNHVIKEHDMVVQSKKLFKTLAEACEL